MIFFGTDKVLPEPTTTVRELINDVEDFAKASIHYDNGRLMQKFSNLRKDLSELHEVGFQNLSGRHRAMITSLFADADVINEELKETAENEHLQDETHDLAFDAQLRNCRAEFRACLKFHGNSHRNPGICGLQLESCRRSNLPDPTDVVSVYKDIHYRGVPLTLKVGEYRELPNGWDDVISSIKVPNGLVAHCWISANFKDDAQEYFRNHDDLRNSDSDIGHDTISSIRVRRV